MIGLLAVAAAAVATCPGGPVFPFKPGTTALTDDAAHILPQYLETMNSELWRHGWITVEPTVRDVNDRRAVRLAKQRERVIRNQMAALGVSGDRVRFEPVHVSQSVDPEDWLDLYPSTYSVSRAIYNKLTPLGAFC